MSKTFRIKSKVEKVELVTEPETELNKEKQINH